MGATKVRQVAADPDFATLPKEVQDQLLVEAEAASDETSPAEAAPAEPGLFSGPKGNVLDLAGYAAKGFGRGVLELIKSPVTVPLAAAALAARAGKAGMNPVSLGLEFGPDVMDAGSGIKAQLSTPEGAAELMGNLATSVIPVGGIIGKVMNTVGKSGGAVSRASNIIRAVGEQNPAKKAILEKMVEDGLELPVSATVKSLRGQLDVKDAASKLRLGAAKADLQGLQEASVKPAIDALKAERPVVLGEPKTVTTQPRTPAGFGQSKPAPIVKTVIEEGSGNPALLSAIDSQIAEIEKVASATGKMKPERIQAMKEQLQDAADKAYKVATETGQTAAPGADAAKSAASAMRKVLEESTDIPEAIRKELSAANKEAAKLAALSKPMEAQRLAKQGGNVISRSIAGLLGRGLTGGGTSALGAASGVEAASAMQNVLFNTLSAAMKKKIHGIYLSEGPQAAVQAAFAAHIAENAARRNNPSGATP
jgi:hypothetical protein